MPKLTKNEQAVYDLLPKGSQRPRPYSEFKTLMDIDKRTLSSVINDLIIKHHIPIGSSRTEPTGYYLIETPQELQNAVRPLSSQANAELKRVDTLLQINLTEFWAKEKADG
ncbi:hypothetical protein [Weissella viridescens]|uniref:hypothetical protein n=1 Tax=Weissella viridescens TaxID=1629 RepID=UPI003AF25F0A